MSHADLSSELASILARLATTSSTASTDIEPEAPIPTLRAPNVVPELAFYPQLATALPNLNPSHFHTREDDRDLREELQVVKLDGFPYSAPNSHERGVPLDTARSKTDRDVAKVQGLLTDITRPLVLFAHDILAGAFESPEDFQKQALRLTDLVLDSLSLASSDLSRLRARTVVEAHGLVAPDPSTTPALVSTQDLARLRKEQTAAKAAIKSPAKKKTHRYQFSRGKRETDAVQPTSSDTGTPPPRRQSSPAPQGRYPRPTPRDRDSGKSKGKARA
ncbi:hypothetical protein DFQ27_004153 [Actinomortierella ambigua]|uniref:Uncharacterized protein n=1 Tax=Actinomortierella ambigua TaxID=1343610 RepID=A0A9P6UCH4_9FUNG|nr:hypothetical protein DFQ27_004153 [Actinomortierella ambigua]